MSDTHEVISAFLDDEAFDASELAAALSDPAGRALLIDLVALRHLAQPAVTTTAAMLRPKTGRASLRGIMAAAAVLVALAGGYIAGERRSAVAASEPPAPTRVVEAPAAWQDAPVGRMR
jgi:hypothetical protein